MHRGNIIPLYCFQAWPAGFDGVAYETCRELTKSSSCSVVSPTRPFVRCNVSPYESIYILFRLYFLMKVTCSSFFMSLLTCLNYATCLPPTKPCESNIVLFYIGIDIVLGYLRSFWLRILTTWHINHGLTRVSIHLKHQGFLFGSLRLTTILLQTFTDWSWGEHWDPQSR